MNDAQPIEGGGGEGLHPAVRGTLVLFLLYVFLVGISFLEEGIGALGGGFQDALLASVSHPISGLCAGLLATVLVQSSSVTSASIVGMVGAGTLPFSMAVPMIMGANIGTTVTSTLAALGSIRRAEEFRKAFAAATMHDFFNLLAVAVLLPLELMTGVLSQAALALTEVLRGSDFNVNEPGDNLLREAVSFPVDMVADVLPQSPVTAIILLVLALALIFAALTFITRNMRRLVAGGVERAMNTIIGSGGGAVGILVGIGVTVAVQSSSITTSILVPLVASGVLALRSAFPITLGANIGTTITALIASLAVARPEGLSIALVHLLFNLLGVLLLYPFPPVREVPMRLAMGLADVATRQHRVVFLWLVIGFLILPLMGLFLFQ